MKASQPGREMEMFVSDTMGQFEVGWGIVGPPWFTGLRFDYDYEHDYECRGSVGIWKFPGYVMSCRFILREGLVSQLSHFGFQSAYVFNLHCGQNR